MLSSTSTASILATAAARRSVVLLTSLSPTPPILPSRTRPASAPTLVSMATAGSTRAISNTSIALVPASTRRHSSTDARIAAGVPVGCLRAGSKAPLMLSTTLSASSGYCVK